jgi:hypothetical protein
LADVKRPDFWMRLRRWFDRLFGNVIKPLVVKNQCVVVNELTCIYSNELICFSRDMRFL